MTFFYCYFSHQMIDVLQNSLSAFWLHLLNIQPLIRQSTESICSWERLKTHPINFRFQRPSDLSREVWAAAIGLGPWNASCIWFYFATNQASSHILITCPIKKFLWSFHRTRGFYITYSTLSLQFMGFQLVTFIAKWCVWNSFNKTKPLFFSPSEIRAVGNWLLCLKEIITCSHLYDIENIIK